MLLSKICIKRPVFATVLSLLVLVLGMVFFTKLQIRGMPNIDPPIITVTAVYDGANASYMEQNITTRIEKILKTVKYLDVMTSDSATGTSTITLSFELSTDIEVALNDVRSKIADITYLLPVDMKPPSVAKASGDNFPTVWLTISSEQYDRLELTKIAEDRVTNILERLPTVGRIVMYGSEYYTMRIEPDYVKMYQHQLSPTDIAEAVSRQNKDYPAGMIKTSTRDFTVRLNASLTTPEDFKNIILKSQDGANLKLQDVAKIELAPADHDVVLRYNGTKSIAIGLVKQSGANEIDLSKDTKTAIANIIKTLPTSIKLEVAHDNAIPVNASIKAVFFTIIEALILVIAVVYLFLSSAKLTVIPFVTIPVSLIGTFTLMYYLGFSINTFTLLAMILAIGLVVDDAIVMLENIFRHHELGKSPQDAAFAAVDEIGFAIIAMTITLAAVFLPVGFIEGFMGKLFIEFAWTLAFCVLFSGFVALTLTPMMASRMIATNHSNAKLPSFLVKFNRYLETIQGKYCYYLELAMNRRKILMIIIAFSILVLIASFAFVNKIFTPEEDVGFLQVVFSGAEGASVKQAEKTVMEAEQILASYKDILGYFTVIFEGSNAFAFVPLKDWSIRSQSQDKIKQMLNQRFDQIPGMSIFAISPSSMGRGSSGKMVEFNLQTSLEYEQLDKISQSFIDQMNKNPIFQNVEHDFKSSTPTLDIVINREKAQIYGVSLDAIGRTVQYLIAGKQIGDFMMGNNTYDVVVRYNIKDRNNINDLRSILVKTNNGAMLSLEVVADIIEKITVKSYKHYNNAKSIGISADLAPNHTIQDAIKNIDGMAQKLDATTILEYLGEIKNMKESDSNTLSTFLFALLFIYLVLSAQFESFTDPLLILVSVPFSITGGVLTLLIAGNSLNMYSNIGLITLIGLITKNSIMIVEFANQLITTGLTVKDAIFQSAKLRLRPILMTTLATIFGAVPLVLADGAGAAARNSIGLVIVGGMLIGTLFTIFVIPVLYQQFKKDI